MKLPTPGVHSSTTAYSMPEKNVAQVGDVVPAISPNKTIRMIRIEFWLLKSPMGSTPQLGNVKTIKVYWWAKIQHCRSIQRAQFRANDPILCWAKHWASCSFNSARRGEGSPINCSRSCYTICGVDQSPRTSFNDGSCTWNFVERKCKYLLGVGLEALLRIQVFEFLKWIKEGFLDQEVTRACTDNFEWCQMIVIVLIDIYAPNRYTVTIGGWVRRGGR